LIPPGDRRSFVIRAWLGLFSHLRQVDVDPSSDYNWDDLRRLVKRRWELFPDKIFRAVQQGYRFLLDMTEDETRLAGDPYQRQRQVYTELLEGLQG
jgi:hypothetical protein